MYNIQSALYQNYSYPENNLNLLLAEDKKSLDGFTSHFQSITPNYPILTQHNHFVDLQTRSIRQNQNFTGNRSLPMNSHVPIYHQTICENFTSNESLMMNPQVPIYHRNACENFTGNKNPMVNPQVPIYHRNVCENFTENKNLMMNPQVPIYHQTVHEQYMDYQVINQILAQSGMQETQEPTPQQLQQLEMQMENEEEALHVEIERPFMATGKPRLRWTASLHARFIRATLELGGIHSATPKHILRNMNVTGLTIDHIKSHLQKVRLRSRQGISLEDFLAYGMQANGHGDAGARRTARRNGMNVQTIPVTAGLHGTYEGLNYSQNQNPNPIAAPAVNALNNFSFTNF